MNIKQSGRLNKLKLNTVCSLVSQVVTVTCGFILPRYILLFYGSDVNGLLTSITQFLALITFGDLGVDIVVQSSLYEPLAKKDMQQISKIMVSAKKFFNTIGTILSIYVVFLLLVLPNRYQDDFSIMYTSVLIVVMSVNYFFQYFVGIRSLIILNADQKSYIQLGLQIIVTLLNTILCICIIRVGATIQVVKLVTAVVYLLKPLGMWFYVKKRYEIDYSVILYEEPIKQKWNGLAQHIAFCVTQNTDVIVLSFFSTLANVSVYNVYNLVLIGIRQLIASISTGFQSYMGNILAVGTKKELSDAFDKMEFFISFVSTFVFSATAALIVPFVLVYTSGVGDANYNVPIFAVLMTISVYCYCIRIPYNSLIIAAGHYKETQVGAIIEMLLNLSVSILLVSAIGLSGVAIGTLIAVLYRLLYFVFYIRNNIIKRSVIKFTKQLLANGFIFVMVCLFSKYFTISEFTYVGWIMLSVKIVLLDILIVLFVNFILYKSQFISFIKQCMKK